MVAAPRTLFVARACNRHGGIPKAVFELLRHLDPAVGVELTAIDCPELPRPGDRWTLVPVRRWLGRKRLFWELAQFLFKTRRRPREEQRPSVGILGESLGCDVAWAHFCVPAWRAAVVPGTPGCARRLLRRGNPFTRLQQWAERRAIHSARRIVAVSEGLKQDLVRWHGADPARIQVIPNGVDAAVFTPEGREAARAEMAARWQAPPEAVWLLLVAAYDYAWKGVEPALEALARLPRGSAVLWVAGGHDAGGLFHRKAEALGAAADVRWLGPQSGMPAIYRACDVYLHPSAWEAFSLASLEAAASGLPILGTRVSGMAEILQDGVNGWFVGRDGADIARRIGALAADPDLRRRMGTASRERALRFSWDAAARDWSGMLSGFF